MVDIYVANGIPNQLIYKYIIQLWGHHLAAIYIHTQIRAKIHRVGMDRQCLHSETLSVILGLSQKETPYQRYQ